MRMDKVDKAKRQSTGISHDKTNDRNPFRARWYCPRTRKTAYIGRYKTREEAIKAREEYIKTKESLYAESTKEERERTDSL